MLRLSGLINKAKRKTLPLILASTLAFTPIKAIAETKKEKYSEEVSIDNKFYTVQIEDKSYTIKPSSSSDAAKKALFAALVKHEIEEGYFSDAFKKESSKLNRLLLKEAIKLTGKCVQEAITDPIKKLKDPVGLLGSLRGITGPKSFINFLKGSFSTWWTNLPSTLERRSVDPKLYAYKDVGHANRSFNEKLDEARELLKEGFTYEEAKEAYSYLKEIKARMPYLIQLVEDINNSKDSRFKVNERDLKEFQILEWEGYGENRHIVAEDEEKLEELRERIGLRVGSSEEYKRYEKAVESAKSKTLEKIVASYELTEFGTASKQESGVSLKKQKSIISSKKLMDSLLTVLPNSVKIEHERIATHPYTYFAEYEGDKQEFAGRIIWPGDKYRDFAMVDGVLERIAWTGSYFWEQSLKFMISKYGDQYPQQSSIGVRQYQKPHDGIPEVFAVPKLKGLRGESSFLIYVFVDKDYIKKFGAPSLSYIYTPHTSKNGGGRLVYGKKLNFIKRYGIFLTTLDTMESSFPKEVRNFERNFGKQVIFLIGNFGRKNFNLSNSDENNINDIKEIVGDRDYFALGFGYVE